MVVLGSSRMSAYGRKQTFGKLNPVDFRPAPVKFHLISGHLAA